MLLTVTPQFQMISSPGRGPMTCNRPPPKLSSASITQANFLETCTSNPFFVVES